MTDLVGHVSDRPARDRRAPLLILRNLELSYEQRSGAINKKEEQLELLRKRVATLAIEYLPDPATKEAHQTRRKGKQGRQRADSIAKSARHRKLQSTQSYQLPSDCKRHAYISN